MPENQIKNELSNAKKIVEEINKQKNSILLPTTTTETIKNELSIKDLAVQSVSKSPIILSTKTINNFGVSNTLKNSIKTPVEDLVKTYVESFDFSVIKTSLNAFEQTLNSILRPSEMISTFVSSITTALNDIVKNIQIPVYTEEEKQKLIENYSNWGKYGWTPFSSMPYELFDTCPSEQKDADKLALSYCDKNVLKECFEDLNKICKNKKDLNEAIICYESRCYKACSMVLFSLIESYFIKKQIIIKRKKDERILIGFKAIDEHKKKIEKSKDKIYFIDILLFTNLFECLYSFFAKGENFKIDTTIANRNFVMHGFSSYKVRKKDCIKLFLLLKNLLEFEI